MYDQVLRWAGHRHALGLLAGLSFAESVFFPIPTDVLLVPLVLRAPSRALYLALLATFFSVVGGLLGYLLGVFFLELLEPGLHRFGYWQQYQQVVALFQRWGIWIILLAGFTPLPYKLFTISAGSLSLALLPFLIASLLGRGARFLLVARVVAVFGPRVEPVLRKYIEWLGWASVVLLTAVIAYFTVY